jgi:hypothetical protein
MEALMYTMKLALSILATTLLMSTALADTKVSKPGPPIDHIQTIYKTTIDDTKEKQFRQRVTKVDSANLMTRITGGTHTLGAHDE